MAGTIFHPLSAPGACFPNPFWCFLPLVLRNFIFMQRSVLCWRLWGTFCVSLSSWVLCPVAVLASLGSSSHLLNLGWLRLVICSLSRLGHLDTVCQVVSCDHVWALFFHLGDHCPSLSFLSSVLFCLFIKKEWEVKLSWICKVENHHKP